MTIQRGQRVVSRSGFVFEVVRIRDGQVTTKSMQNGRFDTYNQEEFIGRFGSQMPPEVPVEKLDV